MLIHSSDHHQIMANVPFHLLCNYSYSHMDSKLYPHPCSQLDDKQFYFWHLNWPFTFFPHQCETNILRHSNSNPSFFTSFLASFQCQRIHSFQTRIPFKITFIKNQFQTVSSLPKSVWGIRGEKKKNNRKHLLFLHE